MVVYRTKEKDVLDWICYRHYTQPMQAGRVEAVLSANPGLADKGPIYSSGILIELPYFPDAKETEVVRLWD